MFGDMFLWLVANLKQGVIYFIKQALPPNKSARSVLHSPLVQTLECTVVELNTRPNPLIISKFLQFRTFWSQTKALFIIRCTLSVESWFKTFRVQKWPYWVQNFEFLLHKITNFRGISGCQWTMPSGLFAKKSHTKLFCSCQLLLVNSKMMLEVP